MIESKKKSLNADQVVLKRILSDLRAEEGNERTESDFFEAFSAEQILKDNDLSYEEIENGIVGKGGDGGIDSVFLFINGVLISEDTEVPDVSKGAKVQLHIVQSKTSTGFTAVPLKHFQDTFEELFNVGADIEEHESKYNSAIVSKAEKFREVYLKLATKKPELEIQFYYATHGTDVHPDTAKRADKLRACVTKIYSNAEVNVNFLGARDLVTLYNQVPSSSRILKTVHMFGSADGSYVCLSQLTEFYEFISENNSLVRDIFEANVRDYQGNVQVNQSIRATLEDNESDNFWFLNNGVTVITPQATGGGNMITIEDPQIVNGLQTSNEIFRFFADPDVDPQNENRQILIRIIRVDDEKARDRIIKATNSQSNIPAASLRGSDHIHRLIEEYFKSNEYYYDRKKNKYKNEGKPAAKIFSIGYVAQSIMSAVLGRPDSARARPSSLINSETEYKRVFDEKRSPQAYLNAALLAKKVEKVLRDCFTGEDARKTVNNLKWYVLHAFIQQNRDKKSPTEFLEHLTVSNVRSAQINLAVDLVLDIYIELGTSDQIAKGPKLLQSLNEKVKMKP